MRSFTSRAVAKVFSDYSADVGQKLSALRELIFATAKKTPGVGALEETLKWGQPSYLTAQTKSGTTIRIDAIRGKPGTCAIYFHCQTTLVESFKQKFGSKFRYEGNRALIFTAAGKIPKKELGECIAAALTYHSAKKIDRVPLGRLIAQAGEKNARTLLNQRALPARYQDSARKVVAALIAEKANPHEFKAEVEEKAGQAYVFHLWHYSAFEPGNQPVVGNPGGKCRDISYDLKTRQVSKAVFWQ